MENSTHVPESCGHSTSAGGHEPLDGAARWSIPDRPDPATWPEPPERLHRRWDRIARLVGDDAIQTLFRSHVVVFGLGGVGSYAVEGLARSGIGRLSLVDFDDVCVTNLNRQLHALKGTTGKPKCELMAERVRQINPDCWVESIQAFYDATTSEKLLTPAPDFVIDAIDNVTAKMHLMVTCLKRGIPIVSSMGAAGRLDPTRVRVCDLSETRLDPFAKALRKNLGRVYGIDCSRPVGIPAVYSEETIHMPQELAYDASSGFLCACPHKADSPHSCDDRHIIHGTAVFVTSVFGMTCASVAIQALSRSSAQAIQV